MTTDIRRELLERYQETGKIGWIRPKNESEALSIIESLLLAYEEVPEEVVLTLPEISKKMKDFLNNF